MVESLVVKVGKAVKSLYYERMRHDSLFLISRHLNEKVFGACFASVAHQHGIFYHLGVGVCQLSPAQEQDRRYYARYYRSARRALLRAIVRFEKNKKKNEDARCALVAQRPSPGAAPIQCTLPLDSGPSPAVRNRLLQIRRELAGHSDTQ